MKNNKVLAICMLVFLLISCGQRGGSEQEVSESKFESEPIVAESIAEEAASEVYLSDFEFYANIGQYIKDVTPKGTSISIQGIKYKEGLCVDSSSQISYNLNEKYNYFRCVIGHDDEFKTYDGLLVFEVSIDGNKIYESRPMTASDSEEINLTINAANQLTLSVKDNGSPSEFVVWADARVVK